MRRKKRVLATVIAVLFAVAVVLGAGSSEAKAATEAKIEVSSATGYEGDTVTVDVSVTENPGMCGITIGIKYDKTVLTVVDAVCVDDVFSSNDVIVNQDGDGFVGYMYAGIEDKTTTGKLLTITFKINGGAAVGASAITASDVNGIMEASNFNGDAVGLTTNAGKVTVQVKNGLITESDGKTYYYVNGVVDTEYEGVVYSETDDCFWMVQNGVVVQDYEGLAYSRYDGNFWVIEEGKVNFNFGRSSIQQV